MSIAKKVKSIVKKVAPSATFGKDPSDPWSAKANITESALDEFLKARGINPKFVSKETKISHSKSAEFIKWKNDHVVEGLTLQHSPVQLRQHALNKAKHMYKVSTTDGLHKEEVDKEDTITFDIPLLIRVLEYAREDAKTDMDLHKVTEKLISIRDKGTLTMADYDFIVKLKEDLDLTEGAFKRMATDKAETERLSKMTSLDKFRADAAAREKKHAEIAKKSGGMTAAIDRLEKHLNKEETEQIDELKKSTVKSWLGQQEVVPPKKPGMDRKAHNQRIKTRSKSWDRAIDRLTGAKPTSEDIYQDSQAATQTPCDCGTSPNQTEPNMPGLKKKELSKSARIIKGLYKKFNMKEELYDSEKEDKSVATYGKKPKTVKADVTNNGDTAPQAAAVLSGGTTLTGQTRDTLEIDPMMKRPTRPDQKQTGKINNK